MYEMKIIYEDDEILVAYKPAGMATQTRRVGQMDAQNYLKNYRRKRGEAPEIYVIHRLDQPVEGLLVFGKTKQAAAKLSRGLQERGFGKEYVALVEGDSLPEEGIMEDYLEKDEKNSVAKVVQKNRKNAKFARLSYRVLYREENRHLLAITLDTGRFHQIRCQCASRGVPLVGDVKYGGAAADGFLCLCAWQLHLADLAMDFSVTPENPLLREMLKKAGITTQQERKKE